MLGLKRAPNSLPAIFKTNNVVLGNRGGKSIFGHDFGQPNNTARDACGSILKYLRQKEPDDPPLIAIVTPSLNQGGLIAATIDSVLSQNYPNLAYHIQDGGSNDETIAVLKSYGNKIQWQSEPDAGQANAINLGFRKISGDIMAYLNSDDTLLPGTLSYVARIFDENPFLDFIYGHRIFIDIRGFEIGRCVLPSHDPEALEVGRLHPSGNDVLAQGRLADWSDPWTKASDLPWIGILFCERKREDLILGECRAFLAAFAYTMRKRQSACRMSALTR